MGNDEGREWPVVGEKIPAVLAIVKNFFL